MHFCDQNTYHSDVICTYIKLSPKLSFFCIYQHIMQQLFMCCTNVSIVSCPWFRDKT